VTLAGPLPVPTPDRAELKALVLVAAPDTDSGLVEAIAQAARLASYGAVEEICGCGDVREVLRRLERLEAFVGGSSRFLSTDSFERYHLLGSGDSPDLEGRMAFGYRRAELQAVAQAKLEDALLLFQHRRFSNAYYLAGYAIEIGLKACIARQIAAETIPDRNFINETYRHELIKLVGIAGLTAELRTREQRSPAFAANWSTVAEWSPEKRYESIDSYSAQFMIEAVNEPENGVFPWIKTYW
jgi:hypothetical protein